MCTHMHIRNAVVVGLRHNVAVAVGRHGVVQFGLTLTDGLAYATDDIARLRGLDHALDKWDGVFQQQGSKRASGEAKGGGRKRAAARYPPTGVAAVSWVQGPSLQVQ